MHGRCVLGHLRRGLIWPLSKNLSVLTKVDNSEVFHGLAPNGKAPCLINDGLLDDEQTM